MSSNRKFNLFTCVKNSEGDFKFRADNFDLAGGNFKISAIILNYNFDHVIHNRNYIIFQVSILDAYGL